MDDAALGIVIIQVAIPNPKKGDAPLAEYWAAALPRDKAVEAVMDNLPSTWRGEVTDHWISKDAVRSLNLKLGGVCRLDWDTWRPPAK